MTVDVVSRVELKAAAAAAAVGIKTTKTAAVAGVLSNILRPHAGTGDTGLEQNATDCVAQRVVAGVIGIGEFGFVATRVANLNVKSSGYYSESPEVGHLYSIRV
jgi:hypothetical protein